MGSIRKREDTGLLFIDFRCNGTRYREQTALEDTSANRKKVQKVLDRLEAEMAAGTFDYRRFFPGSKNTEKFDAATPVVTPSQVAQSITQAMGQNAGPLTGVVSAAALSQPEASAGIPFHLAVGASRHQP